MSPEEQPAPASGRLPDEGERVHTPWIMSVSIRELALEAGVHHTTVSRALKNDPRIASKTRLRIQALAKAKGYQPDPMLSALMVYRGKSARRRYQATLGWITAWPTQRGWHISEKIGQYRGACHRAEQLGYQIEEFWLREPGMTERRISQILGARNIQGLLFVAQPRAHAHFRLDWGRFSTVTFSHTLTEPRFNVVTNHHFRSMQTIMRRLKQLGYRRVGLAGHPSILESVNRAWTGAYLTYLPSPQAPSIPVFNDAWTRAAFVSWFKKHKPDSVISNEPIVLEWLKEMGVKVPQDVGFVIAAKHVGPDYCSGITENTERIGATGVNLLVDMINRGEKGIPDIPISCLVEGTWVEGTTVRKVHS